jgi:pyruvate/2-oxoglutarate dehydrogenase complex dihydrolipoamide dehydrogenase (E3) component
MIPVNSDRINVLPLDEYNQKLVTHVHPPNWINPTPAPVYDLVVIGAGTAGLVVAAGAAGLDLGLKVALVEKNLMGGDCLNFGCVPSKAIIRSARIVAQMQNADKFGVRVPSEITVNFPAVMERMRRLRSDISHHDSAQRFQNLGVDVFFGDARFLNGNTVEVNGQILTYQKAVIATGTRAAIPQITGIASAGFYTNETIFSLTELPRRLAIIGGGAIGCELAQAFRRLGSEVILFHQHAQILNKEDRDAAEILHHRLSDEGVQLRLNTQVVEVSASDTGKIVRYTSGDREDTITVDEILISAGRTPNIEGLNLEAVNVKYDLHGVKVNEYLQTTNPKIYAAGDICMSEKFTHIADATARIVIKNTLFSPFGLGRSKVTDLTIPWVTYTEPEIAHVGIHEWEAQKQGIKFGLIKIPLQGVDRAFLDGETEGFVKILHQQGSDKILGATIVANHAGEMISEITTAMVNKIGLNGLSSVIHPYPTQADGIKKAADAYRRTLLTPRSKRLLGWLQKLS